MPKAIYQRVFIMAQPTTFNAFIATTMAEIRRTLLEQFGSTIQPATNAYKLDMPYYNPESPDVFGPNIPHHLTILFATYNLLANASTAYNWLTWTITSQYSCIKGEDALEAHVKNGAAIADDNIIHRLLSYLELLGPVGNTFIPNIAANDDVVNMKQVFALLVAIGKNFSADMLSLPVKEKEIRQKISEMFPKMIAIGNIRLAECDFLSALRDYDEDKATANATATANNSCADGDRCREIAAKYNNPVLNNAILKLQELKQLLHPPITNISNISPYTKEQMQRFDEVIKLLTTELTLLLSEKLTYPNWQFNSTTALAKIMSPIDAEETVESLGIKQTELSAFIKKCAEELVAVEAVESLIIAAGPNFEEVTSTHNLKFNISDRKIALAKDLVQAQQALEHIEIRKKETALLEPIKATLRCFTASHVSRIEELKIAINHAEDAEAFIPLERELHTLMAVFIELKEHIDKYVMGLNEFHFTIPDLETQYKLDLATMEGLSRSIIVELPKAIAERKQDIQRRNDTAKLDENISALQTHIFALRQSLTAITTQSDEITKRKAAIQTEAADNAQKIALKNQEIDEIAQALRESSATIDKLTKRADELRMEKLYLFFNMQSANYQGKDEQTLIQEQEVVTTKLSEASDANKLLLVAQRKLITAREELEWQNAYLGSSVSKLQESISGLDIQKAEKVLELSHLEGELYLLLDLQAKQIEQQRIAHEEAERIRLQKEAEERAKREREQREAEEEARRIAQEQIRQEEANRTESQAIIQENNDDERDDHVPTDQTFANNAESESAPFIDKVLENSILDEHIPTKPQATFVNSISVFFGVILFFASAGIMTFGTGGLAPITIAFACFIIGSTSFLLGSVSMAAPDVFNVSDYIYIPVYPSAKKSIEDGDSKEVLGYHGNSNTRVSPSPSLVDA